MLRPPSWNLARLGPAVLALTGCFDEPPSLMDTGDASGSGSTTAGSTTTGSTTALDDESTSQPLTTGATDPDSTSGPAEGSSSGETGDSSSGTGVECEAETGQPDPVCPGLAPFCVVGQCVPCSGGGDCGAIDPATPVCGVDDVCRPCAAHSECPGDAGCHLFEGTCLPPDAVAFVDPDGMCGPGDATLAQPACSLGQAFDAIGASPRATIHLAESVYFEPVSVPAGRVYALLGGDETTVAINGGATATVTGTLYLDSIDVQNLGVFGTGIESTGDVWLDDARVRNNEIGLHSLSGRVVLRRSRVLDGPGVALRLEGSEPVVLVNSIVANNGEGATPGGIVSEGTAPIDVLYSTIVQNAGSSGGAIDCGASVVTVRNSIVSSLALSDALACGGASSVTHSVVSDATFEAGPTNVALGAFGPLLMNADYELGAGSIASDVAAWSQGDPATDINGAARPAMDGSPDDAGADRVGG